MFQLRPHQQDTLNAMRECRKGQVIVPTGGGKTLCMINDALLEFESGTKTIVVVCPRLLLANQLCSDFTEHKPDASILHVHSGDAGNYHSTTKPDIISKFCYYFRNQNKLIFTTYHSLHRIKEAGVKVDTIYFDEAHNSVQKNFFRATEYYAKLNNVRCYFFTATPKHSAVDWKAGMNDEEVYGDIICQVPAPELVENGYILPPKVVVKQLPRGGDPAERDHKHLYRTILEEATNKVLVCASSTKQIVRLVNGSPFVHQMKKLDYSVMYITSKTGAYVDGKKVDRDSFFQTLSEWGKDDEKKFVVIHHSILSEGINVSGLESVVFMRNMDYITFSQTIGRVVRMNKKDTDDIRAGRITAGDVRSYQKPFGLLVVPVYSNVGITTARNLQDVVDTVFHEGEPAISVIKR